MNYIKGRFYYGIVKSNIKRAGNDTGRIYREISLSKCHIETEHFARLPKM